MRPRSFRVRIAAAALLSLACGVGCKTAEIRAPLPSRDEMGRRVHPLAPDHGGTYLLDAGPIDGPLPGPSERVAAGLRIAIRADSGLSGAAPAYAVEEYRPSPLTVGTVQWRSGVAGPDGGISGDVRVEWMIGLRERGACAVDVDLVPRLTPACGDPVLLESLRIHRTLTLGDTLILTTGAVVDPRSAAPLLVGARAGGTGRFAIRVRT
jgi:hypothetical protein